MNALLRWAGIVAAVLIVAVGGALAALAWMWQTRAQPGDIPLQPAEIAHGPDARVSVTWFGISTLLFDDGETQIMTDATISRFPLADIALFRPLQSDIATINYVLDEFRIDRLAAIVPLHSHFDHVIDAGHVANRTGAMIIGSESMANVARGSDVPVDQYQILQFGESRYFGEFTVTLLESRHVAQLPNDGHFFPGVIEEPLRQPAAVGDWRSGAVYSVVIAHPSGTTLVQGSAGFIDGGLADTEVDVVMLSIAGLSGRGRHYAARYWNELVTTTGAARVFPLHYDDFTQPFGELALFPDIVDDVVSSANWLRTFAAEQEVPVQVQLLPPGAELPLY